MAFQRLRGWQDEWHYMRAQRREVTEEESNGGTLTLRIPDVGKHEFVAYYSGNSLLAKSASNVVTEVVIAPTPNRGTQTRIVPNYFVQNRRAWVDLGVVVTPVDPTAHAPTGSVTILFGAFQARTLTLHNGSAHITLPLALVARRTITARYSGSSSLDASGSPFVYLNPRARSNANPA